MIAFATAKTIYTGSAAKRETHNSLDFAGVGEHGSDVLHPAAIEIAGKLDQSVDMGIHHSARYPLGVLITTTG